MKTTIIIAILICFAISCDANTVNSTAEDSEFKHFSMFFAGFEHYTMTFSEWFSCYGMNYLRAPVRVLFAVGRPLMRLHAWTTSHVAGVRDWIVARALWVANPIYRSVNVRMVIEKGSVIRSEVRGPVADRLRPWLTAHPYASLFLVVLTYVPAVWLTCNFAPFVLVEATVITTVWMFVASKAYTPVDFVAIQILIVGWSVVVYLALRVMLGRVLTINVLVAGLALELLITLPQEIARAVSYYLLFGAVSIFIVLRAKACGAFVIILGALVFMCVPRVSAAEVGSSLDKTALAHEIVGRSAQLFIIALIVYFIARSVVPLNRRCRPLWVWLDSWYAQLIFSLVAVRLRWFTSMMLVGFSDSTTIWIVIALIIASARTVAASGWDDRAHGVASGSSLLDRLGLVNFLIICALALAAMALWVVAVNVAYAMMKCTKTMRRAFDMEDDVDAYTVPAHSEVAGMHLPLMHEPHQLMDDPANPVDARYNEPMPFGAVFLDRRRPAGVVANDRRFQAPALQLPPFAFDMPLPDGLLYAPLQPFAKIDKASGVPCRPFTIDELARRYGPWRQLVERSQLLWRLFWPWALDWLGSPELRAARRDVIVLCQTQPAREVVHQLTPKAVAMADFLLGKTGALPQRLHYCTVRWCRLRNGRIVRDTNVDVCLEHLSWLLTDLAAGSRYDFYSNPQKLSRLFEASVCSPGWYPSGPNPSETIMAAEIAVAVGMCLQYVDFQVCELFRAGRL